MRDICVVVNSRANYGRVKSVLRAVEDHPGLRLQLILGASALLYRFGDVREVMAADGFTTESVVYSVVEGENPTTMAKSTGLAILELTTLFERDRPDFVITVADRFETLATAVAASYMNIRVAHTQGGEVTGSIDESVRHAVTKLSHLHFPASERAAEYIVRMGEDPETVHLVGCPSIDPLSDLDLSLPPDIFGGAHGAGADLDPASPFLLVLQHPVTTEFGDGRRQIQETLEAVSSFGMQTVWLWPNVDAGSDDISKGLRIFREARPDYPIRFYRNFPVEDYDRLLANTSCIVGNSSSAIREGSFLGTPAVNIGTRQGGRERGPNVIDVDYESAAIRAAIDKQLEHGRYERSTLFGDGQSGRRIADVLAVADPPLQKRLAY